MKPCSPKSHLELIQSWDRLAPERHRQITSGEDLSFHHVIVPTALALLDDCDKTVTLDIGSGTGEFTSQLARCAEQVIAVEPSPVSLQIAKKHLRTCTNVLYMESPIENAVQDLIQCRVTTSVALMSLMTAPNLGAIAQALREILPPLSRFVAILTHPCFWPRYWGYHNEEWFNYDKEVFIEAPFAISQRATDVLTVHIHRSLEHYISTFSASGFCLETLVEPLPDKGIQGFYPKPWRFPRFIGLKWVRGSR